MRTTVRTLFVTFGIAIVPAVIPTAAFATGPNGRPAVASATRTGSPSSRALLRRYQGLRRISPHTVRVVNAEHTLGIATAAGTASPVHEHELFDANAGAIGTQPVAHYEPGMSVAHTAEFDTYSRAEHALINANRSLARVQGYLNNDTNPDTRAGQGTPHYEAREAAAVRFEAAREAVMVAEFGPGAELRPFPVSPEVHGTAQYTRYLSALRGVRATRDAMHGDHAATPRERALFESSVLELVAAEHVLAPHFALSAAEHVRNGGELPAARVPSGPTAHASNLSRPVPSPRYVEPDNEE